MSIPASMNVRLGGSGCILWSLTGSSFRRTELTWRTATLQAARVSRRRCGYRPYAGCRTGGGVPGWCDRGRAVCCCAGSQGRVRPPPDLPGARCRELIDDAVAGSPVPQLRRTLNLRVAWRVLLAVLVPAPADDATTDDRASRGTTPSEVLSMVAKPSSRCGSSILQAQPN